MMNLRGLQLSLLVALIAVVAANGIRKTGSDGALLQGPAANSGIRRRAHGPTGSATGVTGGTGTGATGGSAKKIVKMYLDKTLARKSSTFVAHA